jgi:hypothetical protein
MLRVFLCTLFFIAITASVSCATIILASGYVDSPEATETVLFSSPSIGQIVNAEIGGTGDLIVFQGNEDLVVKGRKKGNKKAYGKPSKAVVTARDKNFDYLSFQTTNDDQGIDFFQLSVNAKMKKKSDVGARITFVNQFGVEQTFDLDLHKGNNVFNVQAFDDEVIVNAFIEADKGLSLKNLKRMQVRTAYFPVVDTLFDAVMFSQLSDDLAAGALFTSFAEPDGELGIQAMPVPEPSTFILFGLGGVFLALAGRRRRA